MKDYGYGYGSPSTYRKNILYTVLKYVLLVFLVLLVLYTLPYLNNESIKLNDYSYLLPQEHTHTQPDTTSIGLFIYISAVCSIIIYLLYKRSLYNYEHSLTNNASIFE